MLALTRRRTPLYTLALVATVLVAMLPASAAASSMQEAGPGPAAGTNGGGASSSGVAAAARPVGTGTTTLPSTCVTVGGAGAADDLMHNRYTFPPHPTVTLPKTLTWKEDPLHDNNWRFQLHSMSWVLAGWLPNGWGKVSSAPVIEQVAAGSSVRFLTLLVPFTPNRPNVTVTNLKTGTDSFSFTISMGTGSQRIVATAQKVTITDLK